MKVLRKIITFIVGLLLGLFAYLMLVYELGRRKAARAYERPGHPKDDGTRLDLEPVKTLRVLPLIDWYAARDELETEPGVAYLVQAGDTSILFDLGLNWKDEAEPPLLRNMARLEVDPASIDAVVISHPHLDHVGGFDNQRANRLVVRAPGDPFAGKPAYTPVPMAVTEGEATVVEGAHKLAPGVGIVGPLPVQLFGLSLLGRGYTLEQSLVVNIEDKGLVVIVGCGHPGVQAIVERAEQVFQQPVYGVIGGLHLPVTEDRVGRAPIRVQAFMGSANPPWKMADHNTVRRAVTYLKDKGVGLVSVSAHDSCDWTLEVFRTAFGEAYEELLVGREIIVTA